MKKVLLGFLSVLLISFSVQAQDISPEKALKKAGKALGSYNLDPSGNAEKLTQAADFIKIALESETLKSNAATWLKAGEVYNAIAGAEANAAQVAGLKGEKFEYKDFTSAVLAQEAFSKVFELTPKKFQKKEALKNMQETVGYLNQLANLKLAGANADYAAAYPLLEGVNSIRDLLVANKKKDIFTEEGAAEQNMLLTAYAANAAGKTGRAKALFDKLVGSKNATAQTFKMYYDVLSATDDPMADEILAKGKKMFPEDKDLLFAEINKLMKANNYAALEGKLEAAIKAEPKNASVRNVMGDTYQRLATSAAEKGEVESEKGYIEKAVAAYTKAKEIDPKQAYASYSIGSIFYNKAAAFVPKMNALGTSKTDQKLYDSYKSEMTALFDKSLPHFLEAEKLDENDRNTLIALKEIYARKNDYAKSGEYKKRLEALEN